MLSEPASADCLQLGYTLTYDDLRDSVAAQQRRGWIRWLVPILAAAVLAGLVAGLVAADPGDLSARAATIALGVTLVLAAIIGGLAFLVLRLVLAAIHRWQARLLLRGNPWLSQPVQATVSTAGIHLRSASEEATISWSHHLFYLETGRSFVLLASKRPGATSVVLPKRGLVADPAQLRALLATHLRERR